jgi:hypothetical protein
VADKLGQLGPGQFFFTFWVTIRSVTSSRFMVLSSSKYGKTEALAPFAGD